MGILLIFWIQKPYLVSRVLLNVLISSSSFSIKPFIFLVHDIFHFSFYFFYFLSLTLFFSSSSSFFFVCCIEQKYQYWLKFKEERKDLCFIPILLEILMFHH